jgi:hypothetical protein
MTTIPKFTSETFAVDENSNKKVIKKPEAIKSKEAMGEEYDDEPEEPMKKPFGSTNLPSFEELTNSKYKKKQLDFDNDL